MDKDYGQIISSPPFKFLVGPEREEFVVHSGAFTRLSKYFDTLINGPMEEAQKGTAVWDDVEPETFVRLCEFAYKRHTPKKSQTSTPTNELSTGQDAAENWQAQSLGMQDNSGTSSENGSESESNDNEDDDLFKSPDEKDYPEALGPSMFEFVVGNYKTVVDKWESNVYAPTQLRRTINYYQVLGNFIRSDYSGTEKRKKLDKEEADIETLFSDTRLYILADRYGIEPLAYQTCHRIHHGLCHMPFDYSKVEDISDLIRFVFENTQETDRLRELLIMYGTCVFDAFVCHPSFKALLNDVGEFSAGILQGVLHRFAFTG